MKPTVPPIVSVPVATPAALAAPKPPPAPAAVAPVAPAIVRPATGSHPVLATPVPVAPVVPAIVRPATNSHPVLTTPVVSPGRSAVPIEETLPNYAPWLNVDPLPPGAAEAKDTLLRVAPGPESAPIVLQAPPAPPVKAPIAFAPRPAAAEPIRPEPSQPEPARVEPRAWSAPAATSAASLKTAHFEDTDGAARLFDSLGPGLVEAGSPSRPPKFVSSSINWRRTIAASVVMMLVTGAAFATAYWFIRPPADGTLMVQASVDGVEVLVDGRARGSAPLRLELTAGRHVIEMRGHGSTRTIPVEITAGVQTTQNVKWPSGKASGFVKVTSTPPGARVMVDGEMRGMTPVVIESIAAGTHNLVLESDSGTVKKSIKVAAGETTEVDVPIFSGWLKVFAEFSVRIFEDGTLLGSNDDEGKILLACGSHTLQIVNTTLGVRVERVVEVTPGGTTAISLETPMATLSVDAPDGTQIIVDGDLKGVTPMAPFPVKVGTRSVLMRPTESNLNPRTIPVQVTATKPARASYTGS